MTLVVLCLQIWATVGSYTMMAKPIRALELHYPMIQFLIKTIYYMAESTSGQRETNPLF